MAKSYISHFHSFLRYQCKLSTQNIYITYLILTGAWKIYLFRKADFVFKREILD
jgi:hypothetical protein